MAFFAKTFIILMASTCIFACQSGPQGVYHVVRKDETLWSIAKTYERDINHLARINNIGDPENIGTGQVLFIPGADKVLEINRTSRAKAGHDNIIPVPASRTKEAKKDGPVKDPVQMSASKSEPTPIISTTKLHFAWPVKGKITSGFGKQSDRIRLKDGTKVNSTRYNNGIKIEASEGSPVTASEGGIVDRAWPVKFYGKTLIIRHSRDFMTVYAHLGKILVPEGRKVGKGEKIALVGKDERTGKPCLHFEIRHKNRAYNPLNYLPK